MKNIIFIAFLPFSDNFKWTSGGNQQDNRFGSEIIINYDS
jgi:hypothetical protein